MHRPAVRLGVILLAATLGGCAGADGRAGPQTPATRPAGLDDVRVCHVFSPDVAPFASGTAVPVGDDVLVSCRHNFRPTLDALWIDGETTPITVFESGSRDDLMTEDWVKFSVPPGVASVSDSTIIDFDHPVSPGEDIYLIGYYGGPRHGISQEAARNLTKTIIHGKVIEPPALWPDCPEEIICVNAPGADAYHGVSGGAAVVYDPRRGRWVVVGIYRGMAIRRTRFLGLSRTDVSVHTVLRVPH